jgi:hypothetical protein
MNQAFGDIKARYVDVKGAAAYLGLSIWSLYRLVDQRAIPFIPLRPSNAGSCSGRARLRFDVEALDGWMKRQTVKPILHPEFDAPERKE